MSLTLPLTLQIFSSILLEPAPLTLEVEGMNENSINMSWRQKTVPSGAVQTFSLTISSGSSRQVHSLNEPYFHFTAPEDAPPCEVYNFSVIGTYFGATYTGADCSVPSRVLSQVVPSLPNVSNLESSLQYSLAKQSGELNFKVSFKVSLILNHSI